MLGVCRGRVEMGCGVMVGSARFRETVRRGIRSLMLLGPSLDLSRAGRRVLWNHALMVILWVAAVIVLRIGSVTTKGYVCIRVSVREVFVLVGLMVFVLLTVVAVTDGGRRLLTLRSGGLILFV